MSHRPNAEEAAHLQYETEHAHPGRSKSVVPYLLILIGAAFFLLLMAYLMQQRTAESVQGLNQSVTSIGTIDQLVEDNRNLHDQVDRLQLELDTAQDRQVELEDQIRVLQSQLTQAQAQLAAQDSPQP